MQPSQPPGFRDLGPRSGAPLTQLPVVYAVAVALQRAGVPTSVMAEQLELPAESMPALLEVAAAKLAALSEPVVDENRSDIESPQRREHS